MTTMFILFFFIFSIAWLKEAVSSDKKNREEMEERQAKRRQRKKTNIDVK